VNGQILAVVGILIVVLGILVSIALHEVGHMVPAKRFGVRCTQYMIGFGTTVWSRRFGDTEYGIKAIPLGGYVRMLGMFPPRPGHATQGRMSTLVEQARRDSYQEVTEEDRDRLYYQRPVYQRLIIMLGGPVMNLVLGSVLITIVVTGFGLPGPSTHLAEVQRCVLPEDAPLDRGCQPGDPSAPGAAAGLRPGDEVRSIGGAPVTSWAVVRNTIRANGDRPLPIVVERAGRRLDLQVTPLVVERLRRDAEGEVLRGADGRQLTERVGFLGVSPGRELIPQPIGIVPGLLADNLGQIATTLVFIPEKLVNVAESAFGGAPRDPDGLVSIVGVGRFAGEIGAEDGTVAAPVDLSTKIAYWLSLLAALNFALFAFNLIPLLPLDGGHVVGALWEGIRRGVARVRGRPDPGPVDVARALPLAYGVASLLIGMSVLLIYADIVQPIQITG
jgi:membrane-associated protease RseP (regulator of RpoE activity)